MNNGRLLKTILLSEGEKIILIVRSSLWRLFWPLFSAVILVFGDFFFLYPLINKLGDKGLMIFAAVQLLALSLLLPIKRRQYFTAFIITNKKIIDIDQVSFFSRTICQHPLAKIADVYGKSSGIIGTIFGLGNIFIDLPHAGSQIALTKIKDYKKVVSIIASEHEKSLASNPSNVSDTDKTLAKIKNKIGEEKFQELIGGQN